MREMDVDDAGEENPEINVEPARILSEGRRVREHITNTHFN